MNWATADYVILSVSVIAGVLGLFIGFSGAMAFLAATVIGALVGNLSWTFLAQYFEANWSRGLMTLVIALLAFGLTRWIVKKVVNGLLKQPADSIFGFVVAATTGFLISGILAYLLNFFNILEVKSVFVTEAMNLV